MSKYVLVDDTHTILWGPDYLNQDWVVNGVPTVPATMDTANSPKFYAWLEDGNHYDPITQKISSPVLSFNDTNKVVSAFYSAIDLDLASAIANKTGLVTSIRDNYVNNGFTWTDGHIYDSNDTGRINLAGAVLGAIASGILQSNPTGIYTIWRTRDGINVPLTAVQCVTLGLQMLAWYSSMIIFSSAMKDTITNLTSVADVGAFDVLAGWPAHNNS